jgi:hypothetical protein
LTHSSTAQDAVTHSSLRAQKQPLSPLTAPFSLPPSLWPLCTFGNCEGEVGRSRHFADAEGVIIHILDIAVDFALAQSHLRRQARPQFRAELGAAANAM